MASEIPLAEKVEIASLVREKAEIRSKLVSAGGEEYGFLLADCEDLAGMIDEIDDVVSKKDEKQHAAFETKIKFSRKIRRKAKDLGNFEQRLVQEYDSKHIQLEHGRKMVEIIKLLRSKDVDKARREAQVFLDFLGMGARLEVINESLSKKRAQLERAKRFLSGQLQDLEWLDGQPPLDTEKIARHENRAKLLGTLAQERLRFISRLQAMPISGLLKKANEDNLERFGFPQISQNEADSLASYLLKSGLGQKRPEELLELAWQSESRLRHLGIDLALFRQEIAGRRAFLSAITSLSPSSFMEQLSPGSPALDWLAAQSGEAELAAGSLVELEKTAEQDAGEWDRKKIIEEKKSALAGARKEGLEKSLKEMEWLEAVLDGKPAEEQQQEKARGAGIIDSLIGFLKG